MDIITSTALRSYCMPSLNLNGGPCDFSLIPTHNWTFGFLTSLGLGLGLGGLDLGLGLDNNH